MTDFDQEARRKRIWSTQASPALGLSKYGTPATVWAYMRGLSDEPDLSDVFEIQAGRYLEPVIAKMHAEATGDKLVSLAKVAQQGEVSGLPIGAHYDFWNDTTKMLHECKFFSSLRQKEFGAPGSDTVPMDVLVQCLHEMLVWNSQDRPLYAKANGVEVDVLFGNSARIIFVVPWDQPAVDILVQREALFYAKVQSGEPPEAISQDDARAMWKRTDGSEKVAPPQVVSAMESVVSLRRQLKQIEAQKDALTVFVQNFMQEGRTLVDERGKVLATWSNDKDGVRINQKRLRAEHPQIAESVSEPYVGARKFLPKE